MKRRRLSLSFAILVPTLLVILIAEIGIYVGASVSLNQAAYLDGAATDKETLDQTVAQFPPESVHTALKRVIETYKEHAPEVTPKEGSPEEQEYLAYFKDLPMTQPHAYVESTLRWACIGNFTDFYGYFYVDLARRRIVDLCSCDVDITDELNEQFTGKIYPLESFMEQELFLGETMYAHLGEMFASGIRFAVQGDEMLLLKETHVSVIYSQWPEFTWRFAIVAVSVLLLLSAFIIFFIRFVIGRPVRKLSGSAQRYVQSIADGQISGEFTLSTHTITNEISELNDAFYVTQESIKDYVAKIKEADLREERNKADLALAERIQSSMVPSAPIIGESFTIRGFMRTAKEVGGDLYNYFQIDDDHVAFFIGDVSGKGVAAALFMAKANTMLHLLLPSFDIRRANALLVKDNTECFFVTAFMAVLEISTGMLRYVNAGHEPVFICHDGAYSMLSEEENIMLGIDENADFVVQERKLSLGDRLFLYTDGVSEANDAQYELFGKERILSTLQCSSELPSEEVFRYMTYEVDAFVDGAPQSDDICMVALDYTDERILHFPASNEGLAQVAAFVDECLADFEENFRSETQVVLDELCSNIVCYAETPDIPVMLVLRCIDDGIECVLLDEGKPFDPTAPRPERDPDQPGGFGIMISDSLTEGLSYRRLGTTNVLRFQKKSQAKSTLNGK